MLIPLLNYVSNWFNIYRKYMEKLAKILVKMGGGVNYLLKE